jgi:hypothetical protein
MTLSNAPSLALSGSQGHGAQKLELHPVAPCVEKRFGEMHGITRLLKLCIADANKHKVQASPLKNVKHGESVSKVRANQEGGATSKIQFQAKRTVQRA